MFDTGLNCAGFFDKLFPTNARFPPYGMPYGCKDPSLWMGRLLPSAGAPCRRIRRAGIGDPCGALRPPATGGPVDAVVLSEGAPHTIEQAAAIVRTHCAAPMILFRCSQCQLDESAFDQVFAGFQSPPEWLARTAELIGQSRALKERRSRAGVTFSAGRNRTPARTLSRRMGTQRAQRP
jgi:hypothetical protein